MSNSNNNKVTDLLKSYIGRLSNNISESSILDSSEQHWLETKKFITDSMPLTDSYGNKLTATGNYDKVDYYDRYSFTNSTLNYPLWLALYNDSWVFKRAIDKPAQDMVRAGITLNTDKDVSHVYLLLKKYRDAHIELIQWGRLFGGSIAVMMFDNLKDEDYKNPMSKTKVKEAKTMKLYVTDRWYGCSIYGNETVDNMTSTDFGKPKYYEIQFTDGKQLIVHHDYILRFENRNAPKLVKCGQLQGWGYAEGSHIFNELMRDDKLKTSIQSLINKSLIEVIKMSGMRGVFMGADKDNEAQLTKRLEMVNWGRTYNSLTFLDKDDDYSMNTFSGLGGLSDLLQQNMWCIASALEMQGILFGDLKSGFANDTEALERYDETIQNLNESYDRPVLTKLLSVLYIMEGIDDKVDFTYNSLLMKKQDETRMEGIDKFINTLSKLLGDGVITAQQYAKSLVDYTNKGIVNFNITDDDIKKLDDNIKNEMENIDLNV